MPHPVSQPGANSLSLPQHILVVVLRTFFKLLYHQFAWAYDWVADIVSLGAWQSWVASVLPYLSDQKTLEIGFGPGHLQLRLHQSSIPACGLDESSQMVHQAYKRLTQKRLPPNLIRGSAESLPFADESFPQVVMTFPAEFIIRQAALNEIYRIMSQGGQVVVLLLAWITGRKPLQRLVAWISHITGEAPEWDARSLEPLSRMGFEVSWETVDQPFSKLLIIQLVKPVTRKIE